MPPVPDDQLAQLILALQKKGGAAAPPPPPKAAGAGPAVDPSLSPAEANAALLARLEALEAQLQDERSRSSLAEALLSELVPKLEALSRERPLQAQESFRTLHKDLESLRDGVKVMLERFRGSLGGLAEELERQVRELRSACEGAREAAVAARQTLEGLDSRSKVVDVSADLLARVTNAEKNLGEAMRRLGEKDALIAGLSKNLREWVKSSGT